MKKTSFKDQSAIDSLIAPSSQIKQLTEQQDVEQAPKANIRAIKGEIPEGIDYRALETKSKHIHVMLKPSLFNDISNFAKAVGLSRNEAISVLIEKGLEEWKQKNL